MRKKLKLFPARYIADRRTRVQKLSNHPFIVPVTTFLLLFMITAVSFVALGAQTVEPGDKRVVHLYIDGEAQTVPTRAKTVAELLDRLNIQHGEQDIIEPAPDTPITSDDFTVNVYKARPVTIVDETGKQVLAMSAHNEAKDIAKEAGLTVYPEDKIEVKPPEDILTDGIAEKVVIDRATPVTLVLYGNVTTLRTHAQTVKDLLQEKGIMIAQEDTIMPAKENVLGANTQIVVSRVGQHVATIEEEIPAPVESTNDPNLPKGTQQVKDPGRTGKKIVTYEITQTNGKETGRRKIQEATIVEPVKKVVVVGIKIQISNPSENVKTGERLAAARGWTGEQWLCLYQLWQKESKWNHLAQNRSSGAYGIPQALPGSKMGTVAPDWQTNPETQILWGLGYIARVYGTPCGAWAKSRAVGWY